MGYVDFHLDVPPILPSCPALRPNLYQPKKNMAVWQICIGIHVAKSQSTQHSYQPNETPCMSYCCTFGYQEDRVLCRDLHVRVELDQRPQPRHRDPRRELLVRRGGVGFGHFVIFRSLFQTFFRCFDLLPFVYMGSWLEGVARNSNWREGRASKIISWTSQEQEHTCT